MASESRVVVFASIAANLAIAATKFVAATVTGSAVMLAEGIHSLVDSCDGLLLLLGRHRAQQPPDAAHPFGYGRELYFWTLIVAVVFFTFGGALTVYEGVLHLLHPEPIRDPTWNYVVLGIALAFDGTSWLIAVSHFRKQAQGRSWWRTIRDSKDPTVFTVVLEDSADLVGIATAFLAIFLGHRLNAPWLDGVGSIIVGLVLMGVAVVMLVESKGLLIGERASPGLIRCVNDVVSADPAVVEARPPATVHLGPEQVLVALDVRFRPELTTQALAAAVRRLERAIQEAQPQVTRVMIEARALPGGEQTDGTG